MSADLSKYLGLFVSEATEHLESLAADLVKLEKDPTRDRIDSTFRHAHSVKGMAASMGFAHTAALAHHLEDLVQLIRQDASILSGELVDLMLSAADALLSQVRSAADGPAQVGKRENRQAPRDRQRPRGQAASHRGQDLRHCRREPAAPIPGLRSGSRSRP